MQCIIVLQSEVTVRIDSCKPYQHVVLCPVQLYHICGNVLESIDERGGVLHRVAAIVQLCRKA